MAGLGPAIHDFLERCTGVDHRDKLGDDDCGIGGCSSSPLPAGGEREKEALLCDAPRDEENKMRAPDAAQREAVRC
jgi:hypothetical protein